MDQAGPRPSEPVPGAGGLSLSHRSPTSSAPRSSGVRTAWETWGCKASLQGQGRGGPWKHKGVRMHLLDLHFYTSAFSTSNTKMFKTKTWPRCSPASLNVRLKAPCWPGAVSMPLTFGPVGRWGAASRGGKASQGAKGPSSRPPSILQACVARVACVLRH